MRLLSNRWVQVVMWMLLIFIISDQPSLPQLIPSPGQDIVTTLAHALEYGIFAVLLQRAMFPEQAPSRAGMVAIWVICLVYAISDESHQSVIPDRDPSPVDVIADVTGAAAALGLYHWLKARPSLNNERGSNDN